MDANNIIINIIINFIINILILFLILILKILLILLLILLLIVDIINNNNIQFKYTELFFDFFFEKLIIKNCIIEQISSIAKKKKICFNIIKIIKLITVYYNYYRVLLFPRGIKKRK